MAEASPPRKRFRVFTALLLALLLLTAGAFVIYGQWTAVPEHVRLVRQWQRDTPEPQRLELAKQVEMRLPTAYTGRVEPGTDGSRTLRASYEEINAWLGLRLEQFLANQGMTMPDGVGAVMVAQRDGQLVVAADVDLPQLSQIVSVYFDLMEVPQPPEQDASDSPDEQGDATSGGWAVEVTKVTAGNVPLPTGRLVAIVRDQLDEKTREKESVASVLSAVAEGRPIPLPRLKVDELRRAQVRDVSVDQRGVRAELRVYRRDEQAAVGTAE